MPHVKDNLIFFSKRGLPLSKAFQFGSLLVVVVVGEVVAVGVRLLLEILFKLLKEALLFELKPVAQLSSAPNPFVDVLFGTIDDPKASS